MGLKLKIEGVLPAIVTPFKGDGSLNLEAFSSLVEWLLKAGVSGVVVAGTTGEFPYLSMEEKAKLFEQASSLLSGRALFVAGACAPSTREAVEVAHLAERCGADALLVVSPYYFKPTDKEVYEHYERVVSQTAAPVILYNIPQLTGYSIPWWVVEGLAELDGVAGIKDSSGSIAYLSTLYEKVGGRLSILCGSGEVMVGALAAGVDGLILAAANVLPEELVEIYRLFKEGRVAEARELQRRIQTVLRLIGRHGASAVKACLRAMGFDVGHTRLPLIQGGSPPYDVEMELLSRLSKLGKVSFKPTVKDFTLLVGEALTTPGSVDLAHIDLVAGLEDGPVGEAFREALREENPARKPALVDTKPRVAVVSTTPLVKERHRQLFYHYATKGVEMAVKEAVESRVIPEELAGKLVIVASVFVHPDAVNPRRVMLNNYKAMRDALLKAFTGRPSVGELASLGKSARHPFRYEP
ncbi:MAG: 4-hydroxy-tetrahydrodipicolinate synthase [Thermoproteota archaeon]|nr:MAG: 4-hydroxy-tetrahydrodipicolinate synthase [Candidatus Korarchaeota archaeon]